MERALPRDLTPRIFELHIIYMFDIVLVMNFNTKGGSFNMVRGSSTHSFLFELLEQS